MAFTSSQTEYGFGDDPVVIRKIVDTIKGGVPLDMTGFTGDEVKAGHILMVDIATHSIYKPMPVDEGAYTEDNDYVPVGVNIHTIPKDEPFAAVLTIGEVNDKLSPYPITSDLMQLLKATVPTIVWGHDIN